jgi:hypothetical protein
MYDNATRVRALELLATGASLNASSCELGISRSTLRNWRDTPALVGQTCPRCDQTDVMDHWAYSELLGWYLGDGHLVLARRGVYILRIVNDARYVADIASIVDLVHRVKPNASPHLCARPGCVVVQCYWKHWPCLFPQHGAGRKHHRRIVLEGWQQKIVNDHPGPFLRGLFHSDGCRITNWTVRPTREGLKRYEYPRYIFSNKSADIIGLCTDALDLLGIGWTLSRPDHVSVARRSSVEALDRYVGPKA